MLGRVRGGCRSRNVGSAVVARKKAAVSGAVAVANADDDRWVRALPQSGDENQEKVDGTDKVAMVCEVTDLVDLAAWPEGTRLIVRREPRHPGAQQSLLPDLEYRFWATTPTSPARPPSSTVTCAPTPTSRTTSPGSRSRG